MINAIEARRQSGTVIHPSLENTVRDLAVLVQVACDAGHFMAEAVIRDPRLVGVLKEKLEELGYVVEFGWLGSQGGTDAKGFFCDSAIVSGMKAVDGYNRAMMVRVSWR